VDFNLEGEAPWIVQPLYADGDLQKFIKENPDMSLEWKFNIFLQICEGLNHCHSKGIFHRDIKPANIFLEEGGQKAVIGDFGLAWLSSEEIRKTATREAGGSKDYMAPEYEDGIVDSPTSAGDIYSLGKVLYFLFSDGDVFSREQNADGEPKHRTEKLNIVFQNGPPTTLRPDLWYLEHVNLIIDKMVQHAPDKRIDIGYALSRAKTVKRLVMERFNPIEGAKYAPCMYCGLGSYQPRPTKENPDFLEFFGFLSGAVGGSALHLKVLACNICGHVQIFTTDCNSGDWITTTRN
jgi:serine/threonine protein kinase